MEDAALPHKIRPVTSESQTSAGGTDEFVGQLLVRHECIVSENLSCRKIEIPAGGERINECGPLWPRVGGWGRRRGGGKAEGVSVVVVLIGGGGSLGVNAGFGLYGAD